MSADPDIELITVFETADPALVAVAKSLLDSAEIEFLARGEGVQDLVGGGRVGHVNLATGPVQFQVREEDAEEARTLLSELEEEDTLSEDEEESSS